MSLARLTDQLSSANLPVIGVGGAAPAPYPVGAMSTLHQTAQGWYRVDWSVVPTAAQQQQASNTIAAFDPRPRKARLLLDILSDLNGLTTSQKGNINTKLFGSRPYPWESDSGINAAAILAVVCGAGGIAAMTATQKLGLAAMYAQDNPSIFVNPAWDSTINVPGDQLA